MPSAFLHWHHMWDKFGAACSAGCHWTAVTLQFPLPNTIENQNWVARSLPDLYLSNFIGKRHWLWHVMSVQTYVSCLWCSQLEHESSGSVSYSSWTYLISDSLWKNVSKALCVYDGWMYVWMDDGWMFLTSVMFDHHDQDC